MTAAVRALGDDGIGPCLGRADCVAHGRNHMQDLDSAFVSRSEYCFQILVVSRPGGRENRRLLFECGPDLIVFHEGEEKVEAERSPCLLADRRDRRGHLLGCVAGRPVDAEASGIAHGRDELGRCITAHSGQNDRVVDPHQVREPGPDHPSIVRANELVRAACRPAAPPG